MKIDEAVLRALWEQAECVHPLECCGLLWGRKSKTVATDFTSYDGALHQDDFSMDCDWLLRVLYEARLLGRTFLGYYHSHPAADRVLLPSSRDLSGHPWGSKVLILGLAPRRCRLFRLLAGDGYQSLAWDPV